MITFSLYIILFIFISTIIAGLIVALVFYKKKINRKLEEDKKIVESGGTPSNYGRHTTPVGTVISVICLALGVISISFAIGYKAKQYCDNRIQELNYKINQLDWDIDDLAREQKKASSIVSSFIVYTQGEQFNLDNLTEIVNIEFVPKEMSDTTTATLTIQNNIIPCTNEGTKFTATYEKSIFGSDDDEVILSITTNGITKSEVIDETLYNSTYSIYKYTWSNYLPTVLSIDTDYSYDNTFKLKKNTFTIDTLFDIKLNEASTGIKDVKMYLCDGDNVLYEENLSNKLVKNDNIYNINDVVLNGKYENISHDYLSIIFEITDNNDYVITQYRCLEDNGFIWEYGNIVKSAEGDILYNYVYIYD